MRAVCFVGDGQCASGSDEGTVCVWDVQTGACLHALVKHHQGKVRTVVASCRPSEGAGEEGRSAVLARFIPGIVRRKHMYRHVVASLGK